METEQEKSTAEKTALNLRKGREASRAASKLRQQKIADTVTLFKALFPHTFNDTPVPLKCNISIDLLLYCQTHQNQMPEISKKLLHATLSFYTRRKAYHHACLKEEAMRVDLSGTATTQVTDREKDYHQRCLDKMMAAQKKRAAKKNKPAQSTTSTTPPAANPVIPNVDIKRDKKGRTVLSLRKKTDA